MGTPRQNEEVKRVLSSRLKSGDPILTFLLCWDQFYNFLAFQICFVMQTLVLHEQSCWFQVSSAASCSGIGNYKYLNARTSIQPSNQPSIIPSAIHPNLPTLQPPTHSSVPLSIHPSIPRSRHPSNPLSILPFQVQQLCHPVFYSSIWRKISF